MARRLHLGVRDITYTYPKGTKKTTHEVAEFLEKKYGVIERFTTDKEKEIRKMIREETERYAHTMVKGRTPSMQSLFDRLKLEFRQYILTKRLDGRVAGVPTLASLRGVNHRLKHPYAKGNPVRPSFFDTGLYVSAFKAWIK